MPNLSYKFARDFFGWDKEKCFANMAENLLLLGATHKVWEPVVNK